MCANKKRGLAHIVTRIKQIGALSETHPEILKEWNYKRNIDVSPREITYGSNKKVWWICERGHEWKATISSRTKKNGNGCQKCHDEFHSSFPEQAICFYLSKKLDVRNREHIHSRELDIYLPELKIGIEYDGLYYHKDRYDKDNKKVLYLKKYGIRVIRILEGYYYSYENDCITFPKKKDYGTFPEAIKMLFDVLNINYSEDEFDIERDRIEIYSQYIYEHKRNSLAYVCPKVAEEWDYEKNYPVTPEMISYGSKKVFWWWWKCKNGHNWKSAVCARANKHGGHRCGLCLGQNKKSEKKER